MAMMMQEEFEIEARMQVGQALLRLPCSLSGAYATAVRLAPQIVMTESDPLRFLCLEKNIQGAAFKLALYWLTRYNCFGQRAFLPMNPSGMGTLTHPDIAALQESCLQRLPDDTHGQAVYILKAPRIVASSSLTTSGTCALFYQLHLSNKNETGSIVLLVDASDNTAATSMADLEAFFGVLSALVCKALPLRVIRVLVISSSSPTLSRSMHSECVKQLIVQSSLSTQVEVIKENSPQELADKLESFGLTKAGLPLVLGFTFGSMPPPPASVMANHGFSFDPLVNAAAHGGSRAYAHPSSSAEETVSSSISIRKEEGRASQVSPALKRMASSSSQEQGSNKKIKANSRSNNNIDSSQPPPCPPQDDSATTAPQQHPRQDEAAVVVIHNVVAATKDETEDRSRRFKQRNAMYSRRKYERKKIEIEVMKKEAHRHGIQNANLLQEQQRLEQLYAMAIKCIQEHEQRQQQQQQQQQRGGGFLTVDDADYKEGVVLQRIQQQQQQPPHASILAAAAAAASCASPSSSPLPCSSELGVLRNQKTMLHFNDWLGTAEASGGCKEGGKKTTTIGGSFDTPSVSHGN